MSHHPRVIKGTDRRAQPASATDETPSVEQAGSKVIPRQVLLAHAEGRRILERAEAAAIERAEAADEAAEASQRSAMIRGYADGFARWQAQLTALAEARDRLLADSAPEIARLAVRIAEKVLRRALDRDPARLVPIIRESLESLRVSSGGALTVRLHPERAAAARAAIEALRQADCRWRTLSVIADDDLDSGGCRVESELGTVDASIETQLSALEDLLVRTRGGRS